MPHTASQTLLIGQRYRLPNAPQEDDLTQVAHDTMLGRHVLIMLLEPHDGFMARARLAAQFAHVHVATLLDYGQDAQHAYLVYERAHADTLERVLDDSMGFERAMRLHREVASAIAAAHEMGIAHANLQPGCVAVVRGGARDSVRVLGFGSTPYDDISGAKERDAQAVAALRDALTQREQDAARGHVEYAHHSMAERAPRRTALWVGGLGVACLMTLALLALLRDMT